MLYCKFISGDALLQAILDIAMNISDMTVYILGARREQKPAQFLSFDIVMNRMSSEPIDRQVRKHVQYTTPNVLIYTSGTTGRKLEH